MSSRKVEACLIPAVEEPSDALVVDGAEEDSPAQKAGIRPQDIILEIDGKDVSRLDFYSIREMLTAEAGRRVVLRIRREERESNVEFVLSER